MAHSKSQGLGCELTPKRKSDFACRSSWALGVVAAALLGCRYTGSVSRTRVDQNSRTSGSYPGGWSSGCAEVSESVPGRFLVTKKEADIASFKTPGLRNVLATAPYFHDGSQVTLWDALDHYNKGDGIRDPWLDQDIEPLALSEAEIDDEVAFLASLTSSQYKEQGIRELERQRAFSRTDRPERDTARAYGPKPVEPKPPRNCAALPAATNSK